MKKQFKDTLKNKETLIQFVMFPVIALLFTLLMPNIEMPIPEGMFVTMFAAMYVGMVPLVNMASIISEEREKKSLKMLIMSNVKPHEYLIGVGTYVIVLCGLGSLAFGLIGGFSGAELFRFVSVMIAGTLVSLLLGSGIGILAKNQGAATALAMPIAIIPAFLPMFSMFNETVNSVARVLYVQQIFHMLGDLSAANFTYDRFIVIGVNLMIFLFVFIFAYKKADLKE
jgi:ABC-2 type transport system permease protein